MVWRGFGGDLGMGVVVVDGWWVGGWASERVEGGGEEMLACACAHACVWLASM